MIVGVSRVTIALPGVATLKEKRSQVRRMLDRVRSRFHIAAAEVDEQDSHHCAVLGFATVGAVGPKVQRALESVVESLEKLGLGEITNTEVEVVRYDEFEEDSSMLDAKFGLPPEASAPRAPRFEERSTKAERAPRTKRRAGADLAKSFRPGSLGLGSVSDEPEKGGGES